MKFKSLFRRGQQSHLQHQQSSTGQQNHHQQQSNIQQQQQQQQVASNVLHQRQAPSVSSLEGKTDNLQAGSWSIDKDISVKSNIKAKHASTKNSVRMQELERELELLRKERARLEANLKEMSVDVKRLHELRAEITFLKEQHSLEVERLTQDNQVLRARLRDVAHSPLSDSEKQQLLLDASRLHNSSSASIAMAQNDVTLATSASNTATNDNPRCATPEWDKNSSSSVSEVSVACLQDRILQMEETHYSTNEELQATIQELSDLQAQLTELQSDNERLTEEKSVLLESLCRQTEKLEDSRSKVDTLQGLLLREDKPQDSSKGYNTEREQKLVDLLKSAQEERETLLQKQEELTTELKCLRASAETSANESERLAKRVHYLESAVDAGNVERKQLDIELAEARQESANRNIEISRLATLLDNARAKIEELEQSRQLETKSEADEMLDAARREKDTLETQAAALQEQLARSHCDHDRLRDQYSQLQEEYKVTRNNAKSAIDDLEYRLGQLKDERVSVNAELQLVRDSLSELQSQCQRHLEDKRELKAALSEAQRRERDAQLRSYELERALAEERKLRQEESTEWKQFQNDLLMTVRVANDFKTEAQSELERVVMENKTQRDKLRSLEAQLEKLNKASLSDSDCRSRNDCHTNSTAQPRPERKNVILKRGRTITKKRTGDANSIVNRKKQILSEDSNHTELIGTIHRNEPFYRNLSCPNFINEDFSEYSLNLNTDYNRHSLCSSSEYLKYSLPNESRVNNNYHSLLLNNIKSIQSAEQNAYHINVSNSKFFVPRDYVYSNMGRSLDDLRFNVDPEMTKILRESIEKKSKSANNLNICNKNYNLSIPTGESLFDSVQKSNLSVFTNESTNNLNEISNDNCQSGEITISAKPILIDKSGIVKDYLISAPLNNPNPHLIMEPKIYIPRLSSENVEREFVYENDQSSIDNNCKSNNGDDVNYIYTTSEKILLKRPMPSPRKLVRFEDEIKIHKKHDEKLPQHPQNISIVNIPLDEPIMNPLASESSDKSNSQFSLPKSSLREKFESISDDVDQKQRQDQLCARISDPNQKIISPTSVRAPSTPTETQQSVLTSVQQEMAARRKANISRQDSRLSVKCLIESIENATKQAKAGPGSRSSSTSSLNSLGTNDILALKAPLRDQQQINNLICAANPTNNNKTQTVSARKITLSESQKTTVPVNLNSEELLDSAALNAKAIDFVRRNSVTDLSGKDPLCGLVKNGGSKRNALLKWCQNKTVGYRNIDITNFSSSWNDGLALCAILHSYLPEKIPYDSLTPTEKRRNFALAFSAAESVGIPTTL
ncbi:hypothetical protein PV326_007226, partial [Microctonus aethiopoides]